MLFSPPSSNIAFQNDSTPFTRFFHRLVLPPNASAPPFPPFPPAPSRLPVCCSLQQLFIFVVKRQRGRHFSSQPDRKEAVPPSALRRDDEDDDDDEEADDNDDEEDENDEGDGEKTTAKWQI